MFEVRMSALASFFLMQKDKFDEYCRMAKLLPKDREKKPQGAKAQGAIHLRLVTQEEMKSQEFQKQQMYYAKLWEYLRKNSKEPFRYDWSGYVICDLMCCLKEIEKIDLMTYALESEDGDENSWVFNKELKDKYFKQVDPSNFSESKMKFEWAHFNEQRSHTAWPDLKPLPQFKANDFPEAGKAMMDGIRIIHSTLNLVDEKSVVLLKIG
jgi:hypothetical protein